MERAAPNEDPWTLEVTPERGLFDLRLGELLQYRDLLALLVRRDFVAFYKQTILGPLWFGLKPVLTTLVFVVVFGQIAGLSSDGLPELLFYLSGVTLWGFFSESLSKSAATFVTNARTFQKVYFPRLIVPLATIGSNLLKLTVQFVIFGVALAYYWLQGAISPNLVACTTPLIIIVLAAQGLGFGLLFSSLTTKYRDLQFLLGFAVQLLMYATPIIYPMSSIPARYAVFLRLNPVAPAIELFRYGWLGAGTFEPRDLLYAVAAAMALLTAGLIAFNRVEARVMDTV